MKKESKRFGVHEIKSGKHKGSLHRATNRYYKFHGELVYLEEFLEDRFLPHEPEDRSMRNVLLAIQNVLEHEIEEILRIYIDHSSSRKDRELLKDVAEGYASFKSKIDFLLRKKLITKDEWDKFDKIRELRNRYIHSRPARGRIRAKYVNRTLLTTHALRQLFKDADQLRRKLINISKIRRKWALIPPGFAEEMNWD